MNETRMPYTEGKAQRQAWMKIMAWLTFAFAILMGSLEILDTTTSKFVIVVWPFIAAIWCLNWLLLANRK